MIDGYDGLVILGLVLLVAAVFLIAGWVGLMAFAGGLLVVVGVLGDRVQGRKPRGGG